ncbi:type II toxin-antitoxin system RelB/DinJ family antitoxin [Gemmatimonas sp.]|uniref:type II toxin-antitoxin system RelB/DinJ family antitoxin n=1 Tax=Gemmatimonas sp. TaxID=1962908 RepID=UPI0035672A43
MAKSATVRARVEPTLKHDAEDVLAQLGISPTAAISMFYEQIALRHALPFEVALPNAATRAAMVDAEAGRVTRASDVKSLLAQLDADD